MDDFEKEYKFEKMKRLKKSLMSLLLSAFKIYSFFKMKIFNSSLNI